MESKNFESLSEYFSTNLDKISMLINLRDACQDEKVIRVVQTLETELKSRENDVMLLKGQITASQESVKRIQSLNIVLIELKKKLNHMVNNIPRLPTCKKNVTVDAPVEDVKKPVMVVKELGHTATGKQTGKVENTYYPEIDILMTDEFEQVPKYLKGRMPYDQVNKFIEGMNKAYRAKYILLKQKKSVLNDANRKRYETYKSQETKETEGCYFIVDDDLKDAGGLKIDNVARSILTLLRHCRRIKEVRGGHITRYAYIDSY